jgi:hypothetical protein
MAKIPKVDVLKALGEALDEFEKAFFLGRPEVDIASDARALQAAKRFLDKAIANLQIVEDAELITGYPAAKREFDLSIKSMRALHATSDHNRDYGLAKTALRNLIAALK